MQSDNVKAFKRELENYEFYVTRVKALNELIDYCYHMLGGIKGVDPSKEPVHAMPNKEMEYKLRDEIEHHTRLKTLTQSKIDYIDEIMSKIDEETKNQIVMVFVKGKTMEWVSSKYYIAKPTLQYRINKSLKEALND